ncbi:MAG: MMPL family transporter [Thermoleophilia bacterium]
MSEHREHRQLDHRHEGFLSSLGRWCARHAWWTVGIWVVLAVSIGAATATVGGTLVDEFTIPDSDAQRATDLLEQRFVQRSGDAAQLVFAVDEGSLESGDARAALDAALVAAGEVPGVQEVGDPFAGSGGAVSEDGRIAFADVQFAEASFDVPIEDIDQLKEDTQAAVDGSGVELQFTGPVIQNSEPPATGTSELLGLLAAVIILVIMLGSVIAAGLPILMALMSVGLGLSLLTLAAAVTNFNTITPVLATMIGLGVGIDYALFIVTRFRQGLHDHLSPEDAAATATATAGRAVLFAGITVAISISALAVIGLDFITKLGLGAAITVVTAVAAAITLLPAILKLLGHRIDKGRVPGTMHADDSPAKMNQRLVARWGRFVTRHAAICLTLATTVVIILALPVFGVQLGSSDAGSNPPSSTSRQAYDLLAEGFGPGFNGPLLVTVDQTDDPGFSEGLAETLADVEGVASVQGPVVNEAGDTAIVTVFPTTSPQSSETQDLVRSLRDDVVPAAVGDSGAEVYVGGQTAAFEDIATHIFERLPLFLLVVIGITFVLLSMAFRSIVVAIKASITTLMSAFASFGILIAVFQWGWLNNLIGLDRTGPIESFLPVIVFSILFGLSMDYEVFLVSRIREEYTHGHGARPAITRGIAAIGRVVVAAALIMSVVFLSFLLGDDRLIKEFGLALGMAILIDAFIVRLIIVPAVMHLMDERMWYMPRWLDKILPRLTIEPPTTPNGDAGEAPPVGSGRPASEEG